DHDACAALHRPSPGNELSAQSIQLGHFEYQIGQSYLVEELARLVPREPWIEYLDQLERRTFRIADHTDIQSQALQTIELIQPRQGLGITELLGRRESQCPVEGNRASEVGNAQTIPGEAHGTRCLA